MAVGLSKPRTRKPRSFGRKMRHLAEYLAFRLVFCAVGMLSPRQTRALAELMAAGLMKLPAKMTRLDLARDNLRTAFPYAEPRWIDDTVRGMWVHLFRMVAEIVQVPRKMVLENCREVLVFRNRKESVKAMCAGRRVLVLGGHFGNWESSIMSFGMFGYPMGVVARDLDNPLLHDWFAKARQETGHRLYAKKGGFDGMTELLDDGGSLALLCDQDAGPRGVFVDYFGKPASTFKSLALLALEHDALIVCGYGRRLPDDFTNSRWTQFEIGCEAVIDPRDVTSNDPVGEITRKYTAALEESVRRAPEQYFWVHRRWKTEPGAKRRRSRKKQAA